MQAELAGEEMHQRERQLFAESSKKWKNFGYRPVTIRTLGGLEVTLFARYWASHSNLARKGKGLSPGVLLLGIVEGCTPALASEVAQLAAALGSFEETCQRLSSMGIR
jgi:hypothetical protein